MEIEDSEKIDLLEQAQTPDTDWDELITLCRDLFPADVNAMSETELAALKTWTMTNAARTFVTSSVENKQVLEQKEFKASIEIGLNHVLNGKNTYNYRNVPVIDPQLVDMDEYSRALLKNVSQFKTGAFYIIYALKCRKFGIEYDMEKHFTSRHMEDYNKYFNRDNIGAIAECRCGSTDIEIQIAQTRSVDEAATVKYVCRDCNNIFDPPDHKKQKNIKN